MKEKAAGQQPVRHNITNTNVIVAQKIAFIVSSWGASGRGLYTAAG
jgi:hypothetical protein